MISRLIYRLGIRRYPQLQRMADRAALGNELNQWALNPVRADAGSVMDGDDDAYFKSHTPHGIAGAALFPIRNAIDSITVTHIVLKQVSHSVPFNHHPARVMSLCRTAFESASQSIWMLSPIDSATRRRRAAGASMVGAGAKSSHLKVELDAHDAGMQVIEEPYLSSMRKHLNFASEERDNIGKIDWKSESFTAIVKKSAKWMAANPPKHLDHKLGTLDLATRLDQQYRLCSSFTHGYNWGTDMTDGIGDIGKMLADAIAVALYVTESAIALFEAQATAASATPPRPRNYPARLQPTIDEYAALYN